MTQMPLSPLIDAYCAECHREARLVKDDEEVNPGQIMTMYVSECCHDNLVTWNRKPIPYGMLSQIYVDQQSWEVNSDE